MGKPKIAFFGTPSIAAQCLQTLIDLQAEIVLVVCQPDKQRDRKNNLIFSATKQLAISHNLYLLQPEKISSIYTELSQLNIDLIITCAYGQIIPEDILRLPQYGCVNIHASLLPKLRGGAPIHWAVINRETETGITFMYMAKQMDAGKIIFQEQIKISNDETYQSLLGRLTELAQTMLRTHFQQLLATNLKAHEQDTQLVTFGYNIKKDDEYLDFNLPVINIEAKVRGLFNKPLAKIIYDSVTYKIHHALISDHKSLTPAGTISAINQQGIFVSTADYDLLIDQIQSPGKKALTVKEMLNGHMVFKINSRMERKL